MRWLLLTPLLLLAPPSAQAAPAGAVKVIARAKGDLTGTGHQDLVLLTKRASSVKGGVDERYRLTVNGSLSAEVPISGAAERVRVVDVDRGDP